MNQSDDFLFQHSKLGIAYIGLDGRCLKINDTMCNMLGYSQEEVQHIDYQNLIHPDDLKEGTVEFLQLLEGTVEQFTTDKRFIHKKGNIVWLNKTLSMIRSKTNEPQLLIAQVQNITDRKRAEEALTEAEANSHKVFEQALVGIYLHQEGKLKYINPYLADMFGYTREEFLQLKGKDLLVDEDYVKVAEQARRSLTENNETLMFAVRGRKKNQSIIHLEGHCSLTTYKGKTSIQGTVYDVTYKKQTEDLLRENANSFQRMLEYLPEPIVVHREGIIFYANKTAVQLVKAKFDAGIELIGKSIFDLLNQDDYVEINDKIQQLMHTNEASEFKERIIRCSNGELHHAEISSIRIDDANGKPVILSVFRNITERKQAEEMLIRSEKLSAIGQLAAGVAHEIRNPLTSLMGFTKVLKAKSTNQESLYFDIMQQELERINLIVNEFMTLAKPNLHEFNNGNLVDIFSSVISVLETQAIMTNVNIRKNYTDKMPCIYCDENQLKQVFLNIIKNAIEAMPEGGDIIITIREVKSAKLHIQIEDQGIGIPHTIIERIGETFFTTKEKGTGLGLMISKRIIEDHQGSFQISSDGKKGTIVDIYLPNFSQLTVSDFI